VSTWTTDLVADRDRERLDAFVARRCPDLSRSQAARLIDQGLILVQGRTARPAQRLRPGDRVRVAVPQPAPIAAEPEPIPLNVVYEDADLLVVDKPAGLTVHPAPGHPRHTLVNAVLGRCTDLSGVGGALRPGIVHRLDRDTSGLLIVAKNDRAHQSLSRQLKERQVEKTYLALVRGRLTPSEGTIDAPIGRDPRHRKRMAVVAGGRPATTRYRTIREVDGRSLLEVRPVTGRTHQIRVHLSAAGHPIAGDPLYGGRDPLVPRQFLHAWRLAFQHPTSGERLQFEAPLPGDLRDVLRRIEEDGDELEASFKEWQSRRLPVAQPGQNRPRFHQAR